ncbi:hypothetical protein D3C80_1016740 [compost metagenome]
MAIFQLPGLRRTLADHLHCRLAIQAGALGKMQCLGQSLEQTANAYLVDHLGQLAAAGMPHQAHHARIALDNRLGAGEHVRLAAHHHRQRAVFRTGLAAGYRRIEKLQLALGGQHRQLAHHRGRRGGVIDQHAARRHAGEGAIGTQHHRAQIVIVAHAAHHELGTQRGFARRRGIAPAVLDPPLPRPLRRAVVHAHLMAVARQMPGHRVAHHPQPQKCDLCHPSTSIE